MAKERRQEEEAWRWRGGILGIAILSRLLILALTLLFRHLASPYDSSALIDPPCLVSSTSQEPAGIADRVQDPGRRTWGRRIGAAIEGSIVWDGVYYVRIAKCGYEYEQSHAFLPVLPLTMRFMTNYVLFGMIPLIGHRATLAFSGYLINNLSFLGAAFYFHRLSCYILRDRKLATSATLLFCFNPASVFYFSIYSESMFSLLSFAGLWCLLLGAKWRATLLFGLSGAVRSNGVLNAGFLLFQAMHEAHNYFFFLNKPLMTGRVIYFAVLQVLGSILPFVSFQGYGYYQLCWTSNDDELVVCRPWCNSSIPYLYGFVQNHYWNVGFLNYFHWKQLPNFSLASPMLLLATCAIVSYAKRRPLVFFSLGLARQSGSWREAALLSLLDRYRPVLDNQGAQARSVNMPNVVPAEPIVHKELKQRHLQRPNASQFQMHNQSWQESQEDAVSFSAGFYSASTLSFLLKLGFMTAVASFIMHVQHPKWSPLFMEREYSLSFGLYFCVIFQLEHCCFQTFIRSHNRLLSEH
ncbi:hypothetical protein O6H91_22G059900 [Diphasiastrum complanatum]|uniref:Uncharacterized protein n=1 Tax=Diphasiastrum complanatum TaxID=34168 RepID=A0ACC2AG80_DIPCM|nr:hypothetical protein O6H91_22G059900 [Diphasiastrum complanatum]